MHSDVALAYFVGMPDCRNLISSHNVRRVVIAEYAIRSFALESGACGEPGRNRGEEYRTMASMLVLASSGHHTDLLPDNAVPDS